jgi:hypothetical protein
MSQRTSVSAATVMMKSIILEKHLLGGHFRGYIWNDLCSWKQWKEFLKDQNIMDEYGERIDYQCFVDMVETEKSPTYVNSNGHKNLLHNEEGKKGAYPWFNKDYDWDDEDGYSFSSREFS